MKYICVFILLLFIPLAGYSFWVKNLRCEYLRSPLGIDTQSPQFTWKMVDSQNGTMQSAYRIIVGVDSIRMTGRRALPWGVNTWEVGVQLRHQWPYFEELPSRQCQDLLKPVEQLINEKQQPDGLFGFEEKETWGYRLSGTLKIFSFLHSAGIALPQAEKVRENTLRILFNETYDNLIIVFSTANLLKILNQHGEGFDDDLRLKIVERCTELLHQMWATDGAFFTHTYRPTPVEIGKRLGQDVVESNSNATGLAHITRNILIEFLTGDSPPFPHPAGQTLVEALDAATPSSIR